MRRPGALLILLFTLAAAALWVVGDRVGDWWPLVRRSPHEQYARRLADAHLDDTALGRSWLTTASRALAQPVASALPFSANGVFDPAAPSARAWRFHAVRGRRLVVNVECDEPDAELFIDLYERRDDELRRIASAARGSRTLEFEPASAADFVLRVQPELLRGGAYTVEQRAVATLRFPVEGVSARAVQSVFGDPRDSGARAHEGVDIFAPRGAPVVAATDGWVTRVTTNRLGGNVVWVWDGERGQALYYAHLDRQDVSPGTRVRAGDVLGRVGNTGNARTTAPHLHFGIYRALEGAVDPLPFICDAPCGARGMAYAP